MKGLLAAKAPKESAELLGELLEAVGGRSGQVPAELWRELAEAAVRVAAAQLLAGDTAEEGQD